MWGIWIEDWSGATGTLHLYGTYDDREQANNIAQEVKRDRGVPVSVFPASEINPACREYHLVPGQGWVA